MERSILLKNIDQKLAGNHSIQINAGSLPLTKGRILPDHNQRSRLNPCHCDAGTHDLRNGLVRKQSVSASGAFPEQSRKNILLSKLLHCSTKLRLQNDNQCDHRNARHILNDPQDGCHIEQRCQNHKSDDKQKALQQRICSCILNPQNRVIYQNSNDQDLNNIGPSDCRNMQYICVIGKHFL